MLEMPKIKIEVERMKYSIIHAFSTHNDEIKDAVEKGLDEAIASYDFAGEISRVSNAVIGEVIKDCILNYFRYGDGRKLINDMVVKSIEKLNKED